MSGNKEVIFVSRPKDKIEDSNFKIQDKETPKLTQDGQVLLRTLYLSVDPYMRPKMTEAKSYTAMFDLDKTFFGPGLAQVVESRNENFKEKQIVRGIVRWNKTDVYSAQEIKESGLNVISPVLELSDYLHVTGFTGLTAYIGLLEIGKIKEGDVVLVSGAAGATGSIVGAIAKLKGASKVIGIVGSDEKAEISQKEFGFDEVINYKKENIEKRIENLAPKGVNVYFDNVGGSTLDAALINMAQNGRIVACGAIGSYGKKEPVMNYFSIIAKRLTVQGFIMTDHIEMVPAALKDLEQWAKEGKIKTRKTIDEGIENVVKALKGLFEGSNVGKAMVHIADPL